MGCGGSKEDDLPLLIHCRKRKELIKAASDHRFALASAHVAYFTSLRDVGDALRRFVDEELVIASTSSDSPVLTLPSDEGKTKSKNQNSSSSSTSLSHSFSGSHIRFPDDDHDHGGDGSHLHYLSPSSDSEPGHSPGGGHLHIHQSPDIEVEGPSYSSPPPLNGWGSYGMDPLPPPGWGPYGVYPTPQMAWGSYGPPPPQTGWDPYGGVNSTTHMYYKKSSSPQVQSVIYDPRSPVAGEGTQSSYSYMTSNPSYAYENTGFFGFSMRSPPQEPQNQQQRSPPAGPPPPPSPKVSAWDFLNPFDMYDSGYYSYGKYGYGSISSSPDSSEVRAREGIPDLEDETETESFREVREAKELSEHIKKKNSREGTSGAVPLEKESGESSSRTVPSQKQGSEGSSGTIPSLHSEGSSGTVPSQGSSETTSKGGIPSQYSEEKHSVDVKEEKSRPDTIISSTSTEDDGSMRKKEVTFEVGAASAHDAESSKLSSLTPVSAHGTRDLQEVAAEIRNEFVTASSYGKEVAMLLEVGKLPYQPRFTLLKAILSRILRMVTPTLSSSNAPSRQSVRFAYSTMKLAKSFYVDSGHNTNTKLGNLSSTLEKLYEWEKKLYKEVKDEERLRVLYEKQWKRLKDLDNRGAESSKIDATRALIRKLLTKLNVCIKAVEAISSRIHKLRDDELQPQVTELIYGLIRMWKAMVKCHHKQFQAIMESKSQSLRANISCQRDSSLRATVDLEMELLTWCNHFGDWINNQKSFIESLNGWLLKCIIHEREETPDGIVPFSPGQIGAPPIFVICNDWSQAMETISETVVSQAVHNFASSLRQLWEKQDEEQRQRLKAQYLSKDFERRLRTLRMERKRLEHEHDGMSDKTGGSIVHSERNVELDSMRKKLAEGRARHKEAVKLVHTAASSSLQSGLFPIFESLGSFTSEALKAYEHVRIQNPGKNPNGK